jgi:hypothetical protein
VAFREILAFGEILALGRFWLGEDCDFGLLLTEACLALVLAQHFVTHLGYRRCYILLFTSTARTIDWATY